MFSGKEQAVLTAIAYYTPASGLKVEIVESGVVFKTLSEEIISEYFSNVDPMDKAGAYDIDQRGDLIIDSFSGSYTNIMGLPRETVENLISKSTS